MYGQALTQADQTEAGWSWWRGINSASCCFKQQCLYQLITPSNKASLRRCYAIQHIQQRSFVGLMATHEGKTGLDFCRSISQSKGRTNRKVSAYANSSRLTSKQSKLVWFNLVITRQYYWLRNICKSVASWSLSKMEIKKRSSPCGGHIDPSISPCYGQMTMAISPCGGSIRGVFSTFLYPCGGHLLDIPLYRSVGE
jgi:hypothetical protein